MHTDCLGQVRESGSVGRLDEYGWKEEENHSKEHHFRNVLLSFIVFFFLFNLSSWYSRM